MVLEFFRRTDDAALSKIATEITRMLGESRHELDVASGALLAGARPEVVREDVRETDHRINELEQQIRRELLVHVSVKGTQDITAVLIMLMVSRKVERIGDNAKNIYDLASEGVDLSEAEDLADLAGYRDEISSLVAETAEIFEEGDAERAHPFVQRTEQLQRELDDRVHELVASDRPGTYAVPRALLFRYWKRIVANLEGIVSAVVNPLDRIDYTPEGEEIGEL